MRHELPYDSGKRKLALCEICKPTIPYLHTNNTTIGFSDERYHFRFFNIELVSLYSLFENSKKNIKNQFEKTTIEELIQFKNAEKAIFNHSTFSRGFMLCSSCIANSDKVNGFIMGRIKQTVRGYSRFIIPYEDNILVEPKEIKFYYQPAIAL